MLGVVQSTSVMAQPSVLLMTLMINCCTDAQTNGTTFATELSSMIVKPVLTPHLKLSPLSLFFSVWLSRLSHSVVCHVLMLMC